MLCNTIDHEMRLVLWDMWGGGWELMDEYFMVTGFRDQLDH